MTQETVNRRLRTFMLVMAGFIFIGTIIELVFEEHMESAVQYIPFVLCALGLIALIPTLMAPGRSAILGMRVVMVLIVLGSLFGVYQHLEHNIEFALEIQPNAVLGDVFIKALTGADPLLAPGILALGAFLALAATYYHPLLRPKEAIIEELPA